MFLKEFIETIKDTVDKTASLQDVINKMTDDRLHHIVIVDNNKPIGILTERDFVRLYKSKVDFNSLAIDHAIKNIIVLNHSRLVEYALSMMITNNIKKIVVTNTKDEYVGCIEQEDLLYFLEAKIQNQEVKLSELTHPGNKAVLIDESSTLKYALEIMTTNNLTSLLVTKDEKAVGIISESDIIKLAKSNIDHESIVKEFMHTPIIQIEEYKTAKDMIELMKKKNIRRVVIYNSKDNIYYTLTSKDIASTVQKNYTSFIESRYLDTRDTFNALSEYVIELVDLDDEQLVFWTNSITKANFDINLDDNITKIIPTNLWKQILKELYETHIVFETVKIKDNYYQVKGHYGTVNEDTVIKLFLTDITNVMNLTEELKKELKIKDELLFNQSKLVQMGEMIGNIAHQWRQPLNSISTVASGIGLKHECGLLYENELLNEMDFIIDRTDYLSNTIDTFRNFLKEEKELKELILQDRLNMVFKIVGAGIRNDHIKLNYKDHYSKPIAIYMVTGEIDQVLINILNNAKDVLLEKEISKPWINIDLYKEDDEVIITIEDNGGGIPDNILPKIFDKYFTTKPENIGTGLGLHMSKKIIDESFKGTLYAKNTDCGAKFFIKLPCS